ncbi:MAG: Eco57I restriction-modification methylase domain-containing protein [Phycisphaerales bacterium]|nr:Eco57I restriction-modification methylase domain-containing protein [Phycisphaerales bacterium]
MLDLLPPELFRSPATTFLDPVCKSGVFLREIARRLNEGLADQMPDDQKRVDHILTKQVFGLTITELTALISRRSVYCSKKADGRFSIASENAFDRADGNIRLPKTSHTWNSKTRARTRAGTRAGIRAGIRAGSVSDGIAPGHMSDESIRAGALKCIYCGASNRAEYDRDETSETYAYPFIHGIDPTEVFNVKFDVIIGNPPYQLSDGGFGRSASPIYHEFVRQAKKLEPRYLMMVIPSRWFGGGKGLDEFRSEMLNDDRVRKIVDYEDANEVFPGVDMAGGVCYFLWNRDARGKCKVTNIHNGESTSSERSLNEHSTLIRHSAALAIIRKVMGTTEPRMNTQVSSSKPFGLRTFVRPQPKGDLILRWQKGEGPYPRDEITVGLDMIDRWKVITSYVGHDHAGNPGKDGRRRVISKTDIIPPGTICNETYLVIGHYKTKKEAENLVAYMKTRFFRFLVSQFMYSHHITKDAYSLVPILDMGKTWDDEALAKRYELSGDEVAFIESKIRPWE